jgi:hypothetical protein
MENTHRSRHCSSRALPLLRTCFVRLPNQPPSDPGMSADIQTTPGQHLQFRLHNRISIHLTTSLLDRQSASDPQSLFLPTHKGRPKIPLDQMDFERFRPACQTTLLAVKDGDPHEADLHINSGSVPAYLSSPPTSSITVPSLHPPSNQGSSKHRRRICNLGN